MMSAVNGTEFSLAVFLLTGIPRQEDIYFWIAIAFSLMYVISILGNSFILFIIKTDPSLHEPMYIFLSMLALTNLGFLIGTIPTIFGVYVFNFREISVHASIFQVYFVAFIQYTEFAVLLFMAFDRFIAISNPLRYASNLTLPRIAKMGLVRVLRALVIILPLPVFLRQFQFCQSNVLHHYYCRNENMLKLACSDIRASSIYGLIITILTLGMDLLLIFFSYMVILKTVLSMPYQVKCLRSLNTFVAHFCAVLFFYVPGVSLSVITRFMKDVKSKPLHSRIIRAFIK